MAAEGAGTGVTMKDREWSIGCIKRSTTGRTLATKGDGFRELIPDRMWLVVTEKATADDTGVMQYQWDDRESVRLPEILMPRNYLEIPEPRLPSVFLELAEEARNVILVNDQSCDTEEVQPLRAGLTRPVFVTEMVDSPPVLKTRALRVTGTTTDMIPNINLRGRGEPVNRSGPVGPQNHTEQQVVFGFNTDYNLDPLGPSRMRSLGELNQPLAMGPLGTEGIHAVNDSDRPTAGGPVGRVFNLDPLGPSGMSSSDEWNQPPAVGPVGKPFITGPLGYHVSESGCRRTIQIRSESESSTGVRDPVIQTGSDVQADRVNIGTANGPADSGDTPPSSDSGVHSLGEQWENMSTNSMDLESEQTENPSYGGDTRQLVSGTGGPPNVGEGNRVNSPWTDCVVERKSDDISSVADGWWPGGPIV